MTGPPDSLAAHWDAQAGRWIAWARAPGHDSSPAMARAAASHPTAPVPAVVGDAARLPLATGCADVAAAFMSLQDVDSLGDAVREVARVLVPGGRLALAIVHPINSAGRFEGERGDESRPFVIRGSYLDPRRTADSGERDGLAMTFHSEHRPLQTHTETLADAGFVIERLREPPNPTPGSKWRRLPLFLHILATRR